jgi:hypothetical protein
LKNPLRQASVCHRAGGAKQPLADVVAFEDWQTTSPRFSFRNQWAAEANRKEIAKDNAA